LLTLANSPLNLFDEELIEDLGSAINQAKERSLRALLVQGDGKHFSAGADVTTFWEGPRRKRASASLAMSER
jgi:enoyl-CoA hydratase/carnithine racemase